LVAVLGSALVAALVVALFFRPRSPAEAQTDPLTTEVAALKSELHHLGERFASDSSQLSRWLEARLEGIDSRMTQTQASSAEMARGIFDTLGEVRTATASVAEQAREFSTLQDLLKPPKARGGLGEALLEELLRQVLPPQAFAMQHRFRSGVTVDAAVKMAGRLVCIDSKFPLANYRRMCEAKTDAPRLEAERSFASDVAGHIKDISQRYIVPDEETFDFAVMYVPADGIYGEILRLSHRGRPLFEVAIEARVIPMSPLTMYGYLQTIAFGLKCLSIEKSAEKVLDFCGRLQRDMERFAGEYEVLGRHLSNARGKYEEGARRLDRFRDKLDQVVDLSDEDAEPHPTLEVVGE
jgi:DNA recombination protein RmuC